MQHERKGSQNRRFAGQEPHSTAFAAPERSGDFEVGAVEMTLPGRRVAGHEEGDALEFTWGDSTKGFHDGSLCEGVEGGEVDGR